MKIKALLCALLLPCTLSAQSKGIDVPLHFVPENIPNHEHTWTPNYIHIIGNADKSKSEYISRLKDPKIMEVELIDNQKFQFAVGFDKQGNKWIVPYNFDKYQPYANIPFMFNEDCTNEIIYLRFPRYRQLKAYTLRRYYREEKDKSGKGKTSYGKMMFDGGWFGHHAGELNIANTHYGVKSWMTSLIISDSSGKVLVDRMLDYDPVIMLNKQKYFAEIFDKYKSPHLRLEPLTDSLLDRKSVV